MLQMLVRLQRKTLERSFRRQPGLNRSLLIAVCFLPTASAACAVGLTPNPAISRAPSGCHVRLVAVPGLVAPLAVFERSSLAEESDAFIRGKRSETVDPFGQVLWPAASAAAAALVDLAYSYDGVNSLGRFVVVEAGAGLGLCSFTASRLGASRVIATDASDEALTRVSAAAEAQQLQIECRNWDLIAKEWEPPAGNLAPGEAAPGGALDASGDFSGEESLETLLVAADVLYSEELADALALRCVQICRRGGRALVADSVGLYTRRFEDTLRTMAPDLAATSTQLVLPGWEAVAVAAADTTRRYDAEVEVLRIGGAWPCV